jgi:hypothetical protein
VLCLFKLIKWDTVTQGCYDVTTQKKIKAICGLHPWKHTFFPSRCVCWSRAYLQLMDRPNQQKFCTVQNRQRKTQFCLHQPQYIHHARTHNIIHCHLLTHPVEITIFQGQEKQLPSWFCHWATAVQIGTNKNLERLQICSSGSIIFELNLS